MRGGARAAVAVTVLLFACVAHSDVPETTGVRPTLAGTQFLNPDSFLSGYAEPNWYKSNIPFFEAPDRQIQDVYYYRWYAFLQHIRYATPGVGYIVNEFVNSVWYSEKFDTINAAAGHHIYEARWLRDPRYLDDYETFWLRGGGGVRQYSFWIADAFYARYLVNGDATFVKDLLPELVENFEAWSDHYEPSVGLYWQVPVWDASEYTIGSYQTNDPYHGGKGYRPSLNAYQYGDARAIAKLAQITGDSALASQYESRAAAIKATTQSKLWDPSRKFFFHMMRDNQAQAYPYPEGTLLDGREHFGFVPWYFNMPDPAYSEAWASLIDSQGFAATYGPTTAERRHRLFMKDAVSGCCRWDGVSWPFATSQVLTAFANLLNNYSQSYVTRDHYFQLLRGYALSQYKNGRPYVAEALHPDTGQWIYDGFNHSEHYNHSTYNDLVISGLVGVRPRADDVFEVNPLVPSTWAYFALENIPYHGHLMTVLYDRDGTRYGQGKGLRVYQDGVLLATAATLQRLTATMAAPVAAAKPARLENFAANPSASGYPEALTSYTYSNDDKWDALDGRIYFDDIPNSRWTNYQSPNASDWLGVDFGYVRSVEEVRLYLYNDGGGVQTPASYDLQSWNGTAWVSIPNQQKTPATPAGDALNRISFPAVNTRKLRAVFQNPPNAKVGVVEFEVWGPASTEFSENFDSGNSARWTAYGGAWSVSNGQFAVTSAGGKAIANTARFSDFTFSARVTSSASGDAGLVFRVTNPDVGNDALNGYYVGLVPRTGEVVLGKMNGSWQQLRSAPASVMANTPHLLKIVARQNTLHIYVDDLSVPKLSVDDASFTDGAIGLRSYQSDARFDDVRITSRSIAEAESGVVTHAEVRSNAGASGGGYVGGIDYADSAVELRNLAVAKAGRYSLRITYANGTTSTATHSLSVNGGAAQTVVYAPTGAWARFGSVTVGVTLQSGANTLRFSKGTQFAELDAVEVIPRL
ncbi:MGH1-like glycoside hydrolase domain-containing protein [Hyalangium versicolor]|uniref:MGH1-like glycoside hydrolase domain-containing protein n=1 Tax=Hyalangium versicolor TaxID=2861190 RepID=UPI001CCB5C01|nr:family 16 glycoside hydrolase [Hyalangium versicolor]